MSADFDEYGDLATMDEADLTTGSGLADGVYGDVTVSVGGTVINLNADTVGLTELSATGTPDSTKFLSGDNSWAVPAATVADGSITTAKLGGDVTSAGKALLDDTDAPAQRTTLGLGTAATMAATSFANATHSHTSSDLVITTGHAKLSGNVVMTNANQFYDGPSLSLVAGTWLIMAYATVGRAAATSTAYTMRLADGTAAAFYGAAQYTGPSLNPHYITIPIITAVVLGLTTTVKIQVAANQTSASILATPTLNATGLTNMATQISAIRVA